VIDELVAVQGVDDLEGGCEKLKCRSAMGSASTE
jgi:hypothetical protein